MDFAQYWFQDGPGGDGTIGNSLRFRGAQNLLGPVMAGAQSTDETISAWVKLGSFANGQVLFSRAIQAGITELQLAYASTELQKFNGFNNLNTAAGIVQRDPSAWYHIVTTTEGGVGSKVYINGNLVGSNADQSTFMVVGQALSIGKLASVNGGFFAGYMANVHYIDGQTLDPTDFGERDDNGVWIPKEYTGNHGANGFHLDFSDPADIGADRSGNGNNFTPTGFQLADNTKVTYDLVEDSPSHNAITFNPLNANATPGNAYTSNLLYGLNYAKPYNVGSYAGSNFPLNATFTQEPLEGKYFYQFTGQRHQGTGSSYQGQGIGFFDKNNPTSAAGIAFDYCITRNDASQTRSWRKTTQGSFGSADGRWSSLNGVDAGDGSENLFYGFFYDTASGDLWFLTNNTNEEWGVGNWQPLLLKPDFTFETYTGTLPDAAKWNVPNANFAGVLYSSQGNPGGRGLQTVNAWQMMGETLPVGWKYARSTADNPAAPIPNGRDHFQAITDTGANILTAAQTAVPNGLWWIKDRANNSQHQFVDSVRGGDLALWCPGGQAERSYMPFAGDSVAWCWSAPEVFDPLDTSIGFTAAAGRRNVTAGFSIVTYTPGPFVNNNMFLGTGFQVPAEFCMMQSRPLPGGFNQNWVVFHKDAVINSPFNAGTVGFFATQEGALQLNSNSARYTYGANPEIVGDGGNYVMYCWHSIPGYSAFGKYTGNNDPDGPFIYTGFRPAWFMVKRIDGPGGNWVIQDSTRSPHNETDNALLSDLLNSDTIGAGHNCDFLSNGVKIRSGGAGFNSGTLIYAAFAENPTGGSNVSPANAR